MSPTLYIAIGLSICEGTCNRSADIVLTTTLWWQLGTQFVALRVRTIGGLVSGQAGSSRDRETLITFRDSLLYILWRVFFDYLPLLRRYPIMVEDSALTL